MHRRARSQRRPAERTNRITRPEILRFLTRNHLSWSLPTQHTWRHRTGEQPFVEKTGSMAHGGRARIAGKKLDRAPIEEPSDHWASTPLLIVMAARCHLRRRAILFIRIGADLGDVDAPDQSVASYHVRLPGGRKARQAPWPASIGGSNGDRRAMYTRRGKTHDQLSFESTRRPTSRITMVAAQAKYLLLNETNRLGARERLMTGFSKMPSLEHEPAGDYRRRPPRCFSQFFPDHDLPPPC